MSSGFLTSIAKFYVNIGEMMKTIEVQNEKIYEFVSYEEALNYLKENTKSSDTEENDD